MADFKDLADYAQTLADTRDQSIVAENAEKNILDNCLRIESAKSKELSIEEKKSAELGIKIEELTIAKKSADANVENMKASLDVMAKGTAAAEINFGLARSATRTAEDNISKLLIILSPRKTFSLFFN